MADCRSAISDYRRLAHPARTLACTQVAQAALSTAKRSHSAAPVTQLQQIVSRSKIVASPLDGTPATAWFVQVAKSISTDLQETSLQRILAASGQQLA